MGPPTIAWCTVRKTVLHTEQGVGLSRSFTVHMDPTNKQTKTIFSIPLTIQEYCHIAQASLELRLIDFFSFFFSRCVRNLIIQTYYHQEVCDDAIVFLNK